VEKHKTKKQETEGCRQRRSEGGNTVGITSGGLHPPSDVFIINIYSKIFSTIISMMKGE
jgi:hypothetical protein